MSRPASHSGTWYSSSAKELEGQFEKWLAEAKPAHIDMGSPKIIIAPYTQTIRVIQLKIDRHAGYRFSGPTAAHSFLRIAEHASELERIIVVGPSHREYLSPFAQSTSYASVETPLGPLQVDKEMVRELGLGTMNHGTDIAEHSLEMQFPFLKYVLDKRDDREVKIVPLLLGNPSRAELAQLAEVLYPYLAKKSTLMLISSDFCHWGKSFDYVPNLSSLCPEQDLHQRIRSLDENGMRAIEAGPENFSRYLASTNNTICGREPIRLALELLQTGDMKNGKWSWLHYSQSSQLTSHKSSCSQVSYVSGAYFI